MNSIAQLMAMNEQDTGSVHNCSARHRSRSRAHATFCSKAHQVGAGGLGEDALGGGPSRDERGAADQHRARHRPSARLLPRQHLRVTVQCMQRGPEACMSCKLCSRSFGGQLTVGGRGVLGASERCIMNGAAKSRGPWRF